MPQDFIPDSEFVPDGGQPAPERTVATPQVPDSGQAAPDFIPDSKFESDEEKYGTTGQQIKTGLEGAASAATLGLSTGVERAMGVKPEDIQRRREVNPGVHAIGQAAGLVGSAFIPGVGEAAGVEALAEGANAARVINPLSAQSIMSGIGEAAAKLGPAGEGITARLASHGIKGAAETALFQGGDEISKMMTSDPNQSLQTAAVNVGLAGILGGATGSAFGAVSPLWEAAEGSKVGQMIQDFKGRAAEYLNNPEPGGAITEELANHYNNVKSMADEVYGAQGLKSQEITKLLPEATAKNVEKIASHTNEVIEKLGGALDKLEGDKFAPKLQKAIEEYHAGISENPTPQGVFDSTQRLKQQLQEWGKYNKALAPLEERDFREVAKNLAYDVRNSLEDSSVWGKAATRQKEINKAFTEFLPGLKDFERRFTTAVGDERVLDPGKIATYVKQLGQPNAEIKQEMVKNFIQASEKYQKVISDTHKNLGLENPFGPTALHMTKSTLEELSPGARLADALIKKGVLGKLTAEGLGAGIGAGVGHMAGVGGGLGALIGEHALSPFFNSILPSLVKPLLSEAPSAEGLKAATSYGMNVIKGDFAATQAAKAIFDSAKEIMPAKLVATNEKTDKLEKRIEKLAQNTDELMKVGGNVGHYFPDHGTAVGKSVAGSINYLNSQKPKPIKPGPLDKEIMPTKAQKAAYQRTLMIAEQPLTVIQHIKDGTIQYKDIQDLQALYPDFYKGLRGKVYAAMIDHVSKDEKIPYRTRMGVSLFLGTPIDSTMTPQAIMAAQGTFIQEQNQAAQKKSAQKSGKSKFSELAETPLQARELSLRKD